MLLDPRAAEEHRAEADQPEDHSSCRQGQVGTLFKHGGVFKKSYSVCNNAFREFCICFNADFVHLTRGRSTLVILFLVFAV